MYIEVWRGEDLPAHSVHTLCSDDGELFGMKKLLDVTDRRNRFRQQILMGVFGALVGSGAVTIASGSSPLYVGIIIIVLAVVLLGVTASIKQRWEIEYRGHTIRFENSAVTAERLFLDEGLVARGGVGTMMELRAPIRVGEGAGEVIVALVDARLRFFRLRLFVESEVLDSGHTATLVEPPPAPALPPGDAYAAAAEDLRPVVHSTVLGRMIVAKNVMEFTAALIAVVGAIAFWLF